MADLTSWYVGLVGINTTSYAKVTSAIISLILLFILVFDYLPTFNLYLYSFLALHLIGHLSCSLLESHQFACPKCGEVLQICGFRFKKHKCHRRKSGRRKQ